MFGAIQTYAPPPHNPFFPCRRIHNLKHRPQIRSFNVAFGICRLVSFKGISMHRRIAKFLLLLALAGNLVPVALALSAPPPHACCIRKSVHNCHESPAAATEQLVFHQGDCCTHDCCRAVTTAQWAHPQPKLTRFFLQSGNVRSAGSQPDSPVSASAEFQSTRAPPAC
jgi:hypothetical protein